MKEVLKHIELIENYVEGKLSEQEKQDFETRLIIDSDFKEEFDLYNTIVAGIQEAGRENLKAKLRLADEELDNKQKIIDIKNMPKKQMKYWAVAASVVFVIGIGLFFYMSNKPNLDVLADSYYEKEKGLPTEMSVTKNQWEDLMSLYKNEDYTSTKNKLDGLLKKEPTNDTLNYFYDVVNFELTNYRASIASFNAIKQTSNYYDKSQYRLVLIELKLNNKANAITEINECLLNKQHLYYDKLSQLKAELSR